VKQGMSVGHFRIDMVVENDARRLAVECDGDRYRSTESLDEDTARQAVLERLGWQFVRIRGSSFYRDPDATLQRVFDRLRELGIEPTRLEEEEEEISEGEAATPAKTLIEELEELRVTSAVPPSTPLTAASESLPKAVGRPRKKLSRPQ
jgi:hypothetical protein